jgi:hypothetical protein
LSYGGERGTVGFSAIRRVRNGGRHVARTCLAADWEVDEFDLGHRSAVGGTGRRCFDDSKGNALSYGGETGTIRFYVIRRVRNGGRHDW